MKKIVVLLAFMGMLNSVSAVNYSVSEKLKPLTTKQDDKQSKPKKDTAGHHSCTKQEKAKCEDKKKDCSSHPKGKCCKMKKDSVAH